MSWVAGYVPYGLNGTYICVERISVNVCGEAAEVVRWVFGFLVCLVFGYSFRTRATVRGGAKGA